MTKTRRHSNNTGYRRIKNGNVEKDVMRMAAELGIPYGKPHEASGQPHRNIGFEATSITYEKLDMLESAWVVRGFGEVNGGLVVSEDVMRDAGIDWPAGCERIELNTANLMAVYDPRDRGKGIIEFEELRNSQEWEEGFDEIPY